MSWFKRHKHQWTIHKASFPTGHCIPANAAKGLTQQVPYSFEATDQNNIPYTRIQTYYVINHREVVLYCKTCDCGVVKSCDAFEAQEFEKNNIIYEQALGELK